MDDKDELDEARGAEDALRPTRPGGERKTTGETDPRDAGSGVSKESTLPPGGVDQRAAGTVENPIQAGDGEEHDFQAGDRAELSAQRGGPVDISRDRPRRR